MFTVKGISENGVKTIIQGYKVRVSELPDEYPADQWVFVFEGNQEVPFATFHLPVVSTNKHDPYEVDSVIIENSAGKTTEVIRKQRAD